MAIDARSNFAKATVSTGYDASATSIVLNAGGAARLPSTTPFNATWWNSTDYGDPSDDPSREVVRVTNISSETLTITRAQEATTASVKNIAGKTYKLVAGITKKTIDDIEADISARVSADASLTTRLSTEEATRGTADTSLATADASLTTRLSTEEVTRATAVTSLATADASLTTRLSTEETTRGTADSSLQTRLSTEESARPSADSSLQTRLSTEETTRGTADTSLTTRISTEESTRGTADTSLTTRISAEESVRLSAATSLTTRISAEESARISADTSLAALGGGGGGGSVRTIDVWTAHKNEPPASGFMPLDTNNSHVLLKAVDSADSAIVLAGVIPLGANLASGISVDIHWVTSATTGNVRLRISFEKMNTAITSDSFDTAVAGNGAANGTANAPTKTTLTATTIDSLAAGDAFRLKVEAVRTDGTNDTITADVFVRIVHAYTVA